jgi:hypothetical protein
MIVGLVWYGYARSHTPAVSSVNGIYGNACCGDLTLRDGVIIAGNAHVPFKLEDMKFGLTAYPTKRLQVSGSNVVVITDAEDETPSLSFDKSAKTLTICGDRLCKRAYAFSRH